MPNFSKLHSVLALALLSAQWAQAQTTPDAGSLLQQTERNRAPQPIKPGPALQVAPQPLRNLGGQTITVHRFDFAGNTLIPSAQLAAPLAPFLNRPLDFSALQDATVAVAAVYRKAGWIVRVYLPQQDVSTGVVTIQVVEAVFGQARIDGAGASRVPAARMLPFVTRAQPSGAVLNADALDRALLLMQDMPGVATSGSLTAGQEARQTDLMLKMTDAPLFSGVGGADNVGTRSTGAARATLDFFLNSAAHLGDQVLGSVIHTEGSDYLRLGATVPVGSDGWRVGANGSYLKYRLTSADTEALHAKGDSATAGLEATYPLVRSRLRNLYASFNVDDKRFDNTAAGATVTDYKIDTVTATLYGNLLDTFGGGASSSASVAFVQGRLNLDGSPNRDADALSTRAAGGFSKVRYAISRTQVISEMFSAYASLAGQAASKNLDSAEKFYLGGAYGVRAYPTSEAGGSDGQLLSLELRARLPYSLAASTFYDYGHVRVNHDNDFSGAAALNSYSMKGAGLALGWLSENGISVKVTWARRIGANPNPTVTGRDQDGSLTKNRFWLQASLPF